MSNHRITTAYSEAFQAFLTHTDEKAVLRDVLLQQIEHLGVHSLLDIGAGNGDLSIPLSRFVNDYLAVEQKADYVKKLSDAGIRVIHSPFPCNIKGQFDAVLLSHSLPPHSAGKAAWEPFINAAWSRVNEGGHLIIVTFDDEDSEWSKLIKASDLEPPQQESRLEPLKKHFEHLGIVEVKAITTHVRTTSLEEMLQALSFVWSDGEDSQIKAFLNDKSITEQLERQCEGNTYVFPFQHYLLQIKR